MVMLLVVVVVAVVVIAVVVVVMMVMVVIVVRLVGVVLVTRHRDAAPVALFLGRLEEVDHVVKVRRRVRHSLLARHSFVVVVVVARSAREKKKNKGKNS